jgi:hypothetical protein
LVTVSPEPSLVPPVEPEKSVSNDQEASLLIPPATIVGTGTNINMGSNVRTNIAAGDASASAIWTAGPMKSCGAATWSSTANLLYW